MDTLPSRPKTPALVAASLLAACSPMRDHPGSINIEALERRALALEAPDLSGESYEAGNNFLEIAAKEYPAEVAYNYYLMEDGSGIWGPGTVIHGAGYLTDESREFGLQQVRSGDVEEIIRKHTHPDAYTLGDYTIPPSMADIMDAFNADIAEELLGIKTTHEVFTGHGIWKYDLSQLAEEVLESPNNSDEIVARFQVVQNHVIEKLEPIYGCEFFSDDTAGCALIGAEARKKAIEEYLGLLHDLSVEVEFEPYASTDSSLSTPRGPSYEPASRHRSLATGGSDRR